MFRQFSDSPEFGEGAIRKQFPLPGRNCFTPCCSIVFPLCGCSFSSLPSIVSQMQYFFCSTLYCYSCVSYKSYNIFGVQLFITVRLLAAGTMSEVACRDGRLSRCLLSSRACQVDRGHGGDLPFSQPPTPPFHPTSQQPMHLPSIPASA